MSTNNNGRRGRFIASGAAALLLAGGAVTIGVGLHADPGQPPGRLGHRHQHRRLGRTAGPPRARSDGDSRLRRRRVAGSHPLHPAPQPARNRRGPVLPASDPVALDVPGDRRPYRR